MRRALLTLSAFLCVPTLAYAQDYKSVLDIPAGQTLVNLSATEQVEIDQDLLVGSLRYEIENKDPKKLQDDINEVMVKAVAAAKAYPDVKVSTEQYYVYPYEYDPNPEPLKEGEIRKPEKTWKGQQGLQIKSKKSDQILKLSGELQALGLAMSNLSYTVSPELLEVNVDMGGNYYPQPMMARAEMASGMAMAKMDAPVAEAGQSMVNLTGSARAMLK